MKRLVSVAAVCALALGVSTAGVLAQATSPGERALVTFHSEIEVPGAVLPAGTYLFVVPDVGPRDVVQVFNEDESEILGQWHVIDTERPDDEVTDETLVVTVRRDDGQGMPAVQFWFAPGERVGREFLYPEEQAREISDRTGHQVRSVGDDGERGAQRAPAAQD